MKKILGLDLGTNSIGWALIEKNDEEGRIIKTGNRIIPMDAAALSDFANGNTVSQTADRTAKRSARRLRERFLLRRERLHRILHAMGFLPSHYDESIEWDIEKDKKHFGTFKEGLEPKLAWSTDEAGNPHFLFHASFEEMLEDFRKAQPQLLVNSKKIPYDWTLYYLRKKALTEAITKEELAWILLNFNQKRGYNQLRDEEIGGSTDKKEEYLRLKVACVTPDEDSKGKDVWYNITFEDSDIVYRRKSKQPLDWVGKMRDIIVTTKLDENGNPKQKKDGSRDYSVKSPGENDWGLIKIKTENDLKTSGLTVGTFIYNAILSNPSEKIRGGLVRTIERDYYKSELRMILEEQKKYHAELNDRKLYQYCIQELYPNNETHRNSIANNSFTYLLLEDILFYQRPLKSKKSFIDNCPYEFHLAPDRTTGEIKRFPIKCIAKSNPLFQEFRIWKFISNLRIIERTKEVNGKLCSDVDVTDEFLKDHEDWYNLFEWLNDRASVEQKALLVQIGIKTEQQENYRWNYVEDKAYPMNATRNAILAKLTKKEKGIITQELEQKIWHLLYSIPSKQEIEKALSPSEGKENTYSLLLSKGISCESVEKLRYCKLTDTGYGAYSEKAIKRLLTLMRRGEAWKIDNIDQATVEKLNNLVQGCLSENLPTKVVAALKNINEIGDCQGLPEYLAAYIVYGRHSESVDVVKWNTPGDIDIFLNNFVQHSLRNPVVEAVVLETLRVVRDIWKKYGSIDEVHVEMGRDMKNPSDKRRQMTEQILKNETANLRIKALLAELANPDCKVENVRPHSPSQQDLLRIYEEGVLENNEPDEDMQDVIKRLSNVAVRPSHKDVIRYKCWLDQKYRSPYTGVPIPLSRLFTSDYEIEHIIPQSLYFDDSFSNKVICEAEVNKLKDNRLAYDFIKSYHGQIVSLSNNKTVKVLEVNQYEELVKTSFSSRQQSSKKRKLLMDELPTDFIQRQMNDSRYISKLIISLLSNLVREQDEDGNLEKESMSKNVIACNGRITDTLKRDWGVEEVWNAIVLPRFERMNAVSGQQCFTATNTNGRLIPNMPLELQKGFQKKRIDHRHHAMDAVVIACTSRDHVNLLNNEASKPENKEMKYALQHKLRVYEDVVINGQMRKVPKEFIMPWKSFKGDLMRALQEIIVSFKQNNRVINIATNKYIVMEDGKRVVKEQPTANHYAIRKPLHKETIYGHINLRRIVEVRLTEALKDYTRIVEKPLRKKIGELKIQGLDDKQIIKYLKQRTREWCALDVNKIPVYYFTDEKKPMVATRFGNDLVSVFNGKTKADDIRNTIAKISDTGIQLILNNYLDAHLNNIEYAFSPEGFEKMNENLRMYNRGKDHKPIRKVRMMEPMGLKFPIGYIGSKSKKYAEAQSGTNLYFAVYNDEEGNRYFKTVPLNIAIERIKLHLQPAPETDEEGHKLLFILSPGDLVYLPTEDEIENNCQELSSGNIYKMISCSKDTCYFLPASVASVIVNKTEFESHNKTQKDDTGRMIKVFCYPLNVTRLGEISLR